MKSDQKDRKRKRQNVINGSNRCDDNDNFVATIAQIDDSIDSLGGANGGVDQNIIGITNSDNNNNNDDNNNNNNSSSKKSKKSKKKKDKLTNVMMMNISDDNAVNSDKISSHTLPSSIASTQQVSSSSTIPDDYIYPYKVVNDDHCETPLEAYKDIDDIIATYAVSIGKQRSDVSIYDPYYCEGSMIERLHTLGYRDIYNKKEDFYEMISLDRIPPYDVLVTNPPYSMDHMEQLLRFVMKSSKPWFLLLPNYVYCKDYYQNLFQYHPTSTTTSSSTSKHAAVIATSRVNVNTATSNVDTIISTTISTHINNNTNRKGSHNISNIVRNVFYVTPIKGRRYLYTTPKGRRQEKSAKYTSPFPTFWYCYLPHKTAVLSKVLVTNGSNNKGGGGGGGGGDVAVRINVAHSTTMIPIEIAPDNDPRKKKLRNSLKRSKNKKRKQQSKQEIHQ